MKISVIVPCFNEISTIEAIIENISSEKNYEKEIIVIDDGSTDGTLELLKNKLFKSIEHLIINVH